MSPETSAAIQAICAAIQAFAGMFSVAAAVVALAIAILVERRTRKRFDIQLDREEKLATANMKPLISVYPSKFMDYKAITLCNHGFGTAIVTGVVFSKDKITETKALLKLFTFSRKMVWDYYWIFREKKYYVAAGKELKLLTLTAKGLSEDGLAGTEIQDILESFQQQMDGVKIHIEYSDILGNIQEPFEIVLTAESAA